MLQIYIVYMMNDDGLEGLKNSHLHHMFLLPPFGEVAIDLHVELLKLFSLCFQIYDCCNISCLYNKL